jgi:hypothetical protein
MRSVFFSVGAAMADVLRGRIKMSIVWGIVLEVNL